MAQESSRNQKPEPLEPSFQEPKSEPKAPNFFFGNETGAVPCLLGKVQMGAVKFGLSATRAQLSAAVCIPCTNCNCNRTEPRPSWGKVHYLYRTNDVSVRSCSHGLLRGSSPSFRPKLSVEGINLVKCLVAWRAFVNLWSKASPDSVYMYTQQRRSNGAKNKPEDAIRGALSEGKWIVCGPSHQSGPEKGVITQGVFSLEKSLESLKSLDTLESLGNGRVFLYFPQSGCSLKSLESLNSPESLGNGLFRKDPFAKRPLFPNPNQAPLGKQGLLKASERPTFFSFCIGPLRASRAFKGPPEKSVRDPELLKQGAEFQGR